MQTATLTSAARSAHAVRHAPPAQRDIFGLNLVAPARPPQPQYAFIPAPLATGKPFVRPSLRSLAELIARKRRETGPATEIDLQTGIHRESAMTRPLVGVTVYRHADGADVEVLGWAWLGGGEHGVARLRAALLSVDPPSAADFAD